WHIFPAKAGKKATVGGRHDSYGLRRHVFELPEGKREKLDGLPELFLEIFLSPYDFILELSEVICATIYVRACVVSEFSPHMTPIADLVPSQGEGSAFAVHQVV